MIKIKRKMVYKWYLILAIIYSSISLVIGIINLLSPGLGLLISIFALFIPVIWFTFSIVMLIMFIVKKVERISLWLPSLYLFDIIFSTALGLVVGTWGASQGIELLNIIQSPILFLLYEIIPVTTLIIAIKLLRRK